MSLVLLNSCASVQVPNTEVCAVAGKVQYGANCVHTLSDETREMQFEEFIKFLEPSNNPPKGAALCQSSDDWNKQKTALEEACKILKDKCTYQIQQAIANIAKLRELIK